MKLVISPEGEAWSSACRSARKALRYVIEVEIGGLTGVVGPIIGKKPPNTHAWIASGKASDFVKSEGPLYDGGPIWRIELASPAWLNDDPGQKLFGSSAGPQ